MTVYEPLVADGFEWINAMDAQDYERFLSFDGQPRASAWTPVKVRRVRADERQACMPSDFPWLGSHALVMRLSAVDALRDILESHGEILPLATDDDTRLFVFNARVIDALDESRSTVMRFPWSERIMRIKKVAFLAPRLRGVHIFRLPHRASSTYVSEYFVERTQSAGLRGLSFEKVWEPSN